MRISAARLILFCSLFFCSLTGIGSHSHAEALPKTLLWHDQPLDPYCASLLVTAGKEKPNASVELDTCSKHGDITVDPADLPVTNKDDFYGYHYHPQKPDESEASTYIRYKYIGEAEGHSIIQTEWSKIGNPRFTEGLALERHGDTLRVAGRYPGGDRCIFGIDHMEVSDGKVIVDNHITSARMMTLLPDFNPQNKTYESLTGCALCCIGKARYIDGQLTSFTRDKDLELKNYAPAQSEHACLTDLLRNVPPDKPLSVSQLKELIINFNQTCIEKSAR